MVVFILKLSLVWLGEDTGSLVTVLPSTSTMLGLFSGLKDFVPIGKKVCLILKVLFGLNFNSRPPLLRLKEWWPSFTTE